MIQIYLDFGKILPEMDASQSDAPYIAHFASPQLDSAVKKVILIYISLKKKIDIKKKKKVFNNFR